MQQASAAWVAEFGSSKDETARVLRAHALGAANELGLSTAAALSTAMSKDSSARVRLACALALAEMGDGAHKAVAKAVDPSDLAGGALACAVFARPGVRSAAAMKALREAAGDTDTFRGMLLSEPAFVCLELAGQEVAKLLESRERKRLVIPSAGGLNWAGIVEEVPQSFFATFKEKLSLPQPSSLWDYAMPSELRPLGRTQRLCELYAAALGHVPRAAIELLPELEGGTLATWEDYTKRTQSWVFTLDLLLHVEERFVPLDEK